MARKRKPKNRTNIILRNRAVRAEHTALTEKWRSKYRSTYIVELVAAKFYLSEGQVYNILRMPDEPMPIQQVLFE
jgi:hypothetical protein